MELISSCNVSSLQFRNSSNPVLIWLQFSAVAELLKKNLGFDTYIVLVNGKTWNFLATVNRKYKTFFADSESRVIMKCKNGKTLFYEDGITCEKLNSPFWHTRPINATATLVWPYGYINKYCHARPGFFCGSDADLITLLSEHLKSNVIINYVKSPEAAVTSV